MAIEKQTTSVYTVQFLLLCLSSALFMGSFNMILAELPHYLTELGRPDLKGWIIFLFASAALISRPFSGKLADTIGRMPVMIIGVIVCIIVGFLYPIFNTVLGFFLLRFFHGFSSGFKPTGTTAYLADIIPTERRGELMGLLGMAGSLGMAGGPSLGSWIAMHYGINMMFYTSSLLAILSIAVLLGMKETLEDKKPFAFKHLRIGVADLFEAKVFSPALVMFLSVFSFGILIIIIPDFSDHLNVINRGEFFSYMVSTSILVRFIAGKISDRFGRILMLKVGHIFLFIGMILLGFVTVHWEFVATALLLGCSAGINSPTVFAWNADLAHPQRMGHAMSTLFASLELGIMGGSMFSSLIYNNQAVNFKYAFWIGAVFALSSLIYLFTVKKEES